MSRKRKKDPMPVGFAVFMIVAGLIIGTVFTLGMQYWNAPIERAEATYVEATFEKYYGLSASKSITVYFSDHEQLEIDVACVTSDILEDIEMLSKGDRVKLLVHPNSTTIWEISTAEKTIMSFEHSQNRLQGNNIAFGLLGIFMYCCAAIGIGSLISRWIKQKAS